MSTHEKPDVLVGVALLPSEEDRFARVAQTVKACLDLVDARDPDVELAPVGSPERWPRLKEALLETRLVVADFSPATPGGHGPTTETLVGACAARFGRAIPVVVLVPDRSHLPFGWQDHPFVVEYEGSRDGITELRRNLGAGLQALVKQIRAGETVVDEGFATVTITTAATPQPAEGQTEEEEDPVEKERRVKQMLRERFRQKLAEVPDASASATTTEDTEDDEASRETVVARRPRPQAHGESDTAADLAAGERVVPEIPDIPVGEVGETPAEKLAALQKRLQQRWAAERAARPKWLRDTVVEYGFDLNFWVEPAAEPVVHRGITQAVSEVGGLVDGKPPPQQQEKETQEDDESDDDIVFDPSDIDILKGTKKKKKKKKKKKRPTADTPAAIATEGAGAETAPPRGLGERKGLGVLLDRLSGRRLELRPAQIVLGRGQDADVVLAAREISKAHTRISKQEGGYMIENLGTNGTFVNDEAITHPRRLQHGDQITLAKTQDKPEGVRHFVFQQAQA